MVETGLRIGRLTEGQLKALAGPGHLVGLAMAHCALVSLVSN